MRRIDLGCGTNKQTGFLGVDRYPLPGVDVVADMNGFLPFPNDSVDLLFASHSLEHVKALLWTMKEVYRICKHGAQLCIIAPYSEQKLDRANPYHTWAFNEHTPRFWTDFATAPIDPKEYYHPQAPQWGLASSDHSDPGIDFRLVRMEHFYFPRYAGLPSAERRRLRQERPDVCDQIMYNLIVWKVDAAIPGKPFDSYVAEFQPYEPEYIPFLRDRRCEMPVKDPGDPEERLRQNWASSKDEAQQLRDHSVHLTAEITRLHEHCAAQTQVVGRLTSQLNDTAAYNRVLRDDVAKAGQELEAARASLRREETNAAASRVEISSLRQQVRDLQAQLQSAAVLRAKLRLVQAELDTTAALLDVQRQKEEGFSDQITCARRAAAAAIQEAERWKHLWGKANQSLTTLCDGLRTTEVAHTLRVGGLVIGRDRQFQKLPKGFIPLREYCDRHFHTARASVILSDNLNRVAYREYIIPFAVEQLTAVSLAVFTLLSEGPGILGIEIVSAGSDIVAHVRRQLALIPSNEITEFPLQVPLPTLQRGWSLRVFTRDAEGPVSVYELGKGSLLHDTMQSFPLVLLSEA